MRRCRHLVAVASPMVMAAVLVLAACASAGPPVRLHTLMSAELAPRSAAVAGGVPEPIAVEPIRLPAQVDQPQWLVRLTDGSLAALEQERWASPLGDEFRQALLEELFAHAGVVESRNSAAGAAPAVRVAIDVRRFDSIVGREARIEGSWTLLPASSGALSVRCEWLLREPAPAGMAELAAAHRRAIVRLADGLGDSLVSLRRGERVACPPSDPR
jgi:uncharacterized lipoprotein YmbA